MSANNITSFMSDFAAQLVANAAIQAYCQSKFSKNLQVQIGQTAKEPPTVAQCPLVILTPGGRGTTEDGNLKNRSIRIGINIQADCTFTGTNVRSIPAMALLDELADLIEKFITNYRETSGYGVCALVGGPDDMTEDDILKTWLALGVQLDSDYI